MPKGKRSKKKLTSVRFAFAHTYTLEKLTLLPIFVKVQAKDGHFFGQKYEQNSSFGD